MSNLATLHSVPLHASGPACGPAAGPASGPDDLAVRALIAGELDRIRAILEDLGVELCTDAEIVRSHMHVLQSIDELCQRHENLARTLRAHDMVAETDRITLDSLRTRLLSAYSA